MSTTSRMLFLACVLCLPQLAPAQDSAPVPEAKSFAEAVDLSPLAQSALHSEGRVKSLDSFAREMMQLVSGPRSFEEQTRVFTYLDLVIRPNRYRDADIVYVKKKQVRERIIDALRTSEMALATPKFDQRMEAFMDRGLTSSRFLFDPHVARVMEELNADLIKTAKSVREIQTGVTVMQPEFLLDRLAIIPPPQGNADTPWLTMRELVGEGASPALAELDPALLSQLTLAWRELVSGWLNEDAVAVNQAAGELAEVLPRVNPALYPVGDKLRWENFYFRAKNLTWVWLIYLASVVPLLVSVIYGWRGARWAGMGLFLLAFALHTFALGLRWYVAGRFPNSNMFEAVTTSVWFGGCAAIIIEILVRRSPMRNFFALGAAVTSMIALMSAHFLPLYLDAHITNRMPVLYDVWLYIHTNVIIFSYALIFIAVVPAVGYLLYRLAGKLTGRFGSHDDYARVGGAGSLIMTAPTGGAYLAPSRSTAGQVLDGVTMVVLELAFIMLWAGLVMGAIWADHSWGRPWGWDPKEVFALNTFLVFAVLIHLRLKTRDKGLWTALLAITGAVVMLFNWIVINFVITGLHSYA